jgi:hypothetical protein
MCVKLFSLVLLFSISTGFAATFTVNSQSTFNTAHTNAASGDIIEWTSGTYSNIFMNITKSNITIQAQTAGDVIFNGSSRVELRGSNLNFIGFQYSGGDIGTSNVMRIYGSNITVSDINISGYTCYKYLIVEQNTQYVTVQYCNFENRINTPDQNILSILVGSTPGYHLVRYCSFKNFVGSNTLGDAGVEPIRIGVSTTASNQSRSIVEYCYFTGCDGDGEIISHKATQCVYRYNTLENNQYGELVLRHGDQGIVYGNFFINNKGGVRVREGSGHVIYNNYFSDLKDRSIYFVGNGTNTVSDVLVAYNTIVKSANVILSDNNSTPPTNITFANNIFSESTDSSLFLNPTGTETWIGNIANGSLGFTTPAGITQANPSLSLNSEGYYSLAASSIAINAATSGYATLPIITNLTYDNDILLDVASSSRPSSIALKDVGCQEYSTSATIKPYVDENNTGPRYLMPTLTANDFINQLDGDFKVFPNPMIDNNINFEFNIGKSLEISIKLYDIQGKLISIISPNSLFDSGSHIINKKLELAAGIYLAKIQVIDSTTNKIAQQTYKIIKK